MERLAVIKFWTKLLAFLGQAPMYDFETRQISFKSNPLRFCILFFYILTILMAFHTWTQMNYSNRLIKFETGVFLSTILVYGKILLIIEKLCRNFAKKSAWRDMISKMCCIDEKLRNANAKRNNNYLHLAIFIMVFMFFCGVPQYIAIFRQLYPTLLFCSQLFGIIAYVSSKFLFVRCLSDYYGDLNAILERSIRKKLLKNVQQTKQIRSIGKMYRILHEIVEHFNNFHGNASFLFTSLMLISLLLSLNNVSLCLITKNIQHLDYVQLTSTGIQSVAQKPKSFINNFI